MSKIKMFFTSRYKGTFSWMLCPFLQRLNFLSLDVSLKIVLVTLNICLKYKDEVINVLVTRLQMTALS